MVRTASKIIDLLSIFRSYDCWRILVFRQFWHIGISRFFKVNGNASAGLSAPLLMSLVDALAAQAECRNNASGRPCQRL